MRHLRRWSIDAPIRLALLDPADEASVIAAFGEACRASGPGARRADHVLLPTGRQRAAARRALPRDMDPRAVYDLAPALGNPAGAANLLQVAASVALLAAGTQAGPGLVLAAGIEGTVSAVILGAVEPSGTPWNS